MVELEVTYISLEDGSEFVTTVIAEGADNGDKGGRKAVTQAQKIANLLTFNIATGEPDPDGMEVVASMSGGSDPCPEEVLLQLALAVLRKSITKSRRSLVPTNSLAQSLTVSVTGFPVAMLSG